MNRYIIPIIFIYISMVVGLCLIIPFNGMFLSNFELSRSLNNVLNGILISAITLPLLFFLQSQWVKHPFRSIGFNRSGKAIGFFLLGLGIIAIPQTIGLIANTMFGWQEIVLRPSQSALISVILGLAGVILYESLPEELIFRGFIFSNLNRLSPKWVSAIIILVMFILLPVAAMSTVSMFTEMEFRIGAGTSINLMYVVTLSTFGAAMVYLRVMTDSVWSCVGFHTSFVYFDRLKGPSEDDFIQITQVYNQGAMQISSLVVLAVVLVGLLAAPFVLKIKMGWNDTLSDDRETEADHKNE